jgi:hypothetical protein
MSTIPWALYCNLGANTAHSLQFTPCELWSRPYTMYLQLRIFRLQYSTERICAAIGDISTIQCALLCKHWVQHSVHHPVYVMCTVVPDMYKVFAAPHSQATIFNWTWLRCNYRYADIWMRDILQSGCRIQRTSSSLRNVYCSPGHIQSIYSSAYSGRTIQLNVSALLLEIWRQFNEGCTTSFAPNTAHIPQFTLCELWPRLFTMYLQLRIFRLQYSAIGICAAIGDIPKIRRALYRKHWAKYNGHPPGYAMWNLVPDIYNEFTAPYIPASRFIWTYLRCYWRYLENSMSVILETWCQI